MRRKGDKVKEKEKEKTSEKKYEKMRHSHRNIRKRQKSSSSSSGDSSAEESKINTRRSRSREKSSAKKIEKPRISVGKMRPSRSDSENEATSSRSHKSSKKQESDPVTKTAPKKDNAGDDEWKEDKSFWEGEDVKSDTADQKHKDKESKSSVWQVKTSDTDGDSHKLKLCIVRPSEPSSQRSPRQTRRSSGHHHSRKEETEGDSSQEKKKPSDSPDEKRKTRKSSREEYKNVDSSEETVSVVKEEIKYDQIPHSLDDIQLPDESDNMPSEVIRFKNSTSENLESCDKETTETNDDQNIFEQPDSHPDVEPEDLKEAGSDETVKGIDKSDNNTEKKETESEKPHIDSCKESNETETEDDKEKPEPLSSNESCEPDVKEESSVGKTNRRDSSDKMSNERRSEERHSSSESSSPKRKYKTRDASENRSDEKDSSEDRDSSEERKGHRSSIHKVEKSSTLKNERKERSRSRSRSRSSQENTKRSRSRSSSHEKVNDEESKDTVSKGSKSQGKHQRIKLKRDREVSFDRRFSAGDADKMESLSTDSRKDRKSVDCELESENKIEDDSLSASDSALDSKKAAIRRKLSRALSSVNSRPVINRSQYKLLDENNAESCNTSDKSLSPQRAVEKNKSRDSSPPVRREKISLKRPSSRIETSFVENDKNDTELDNKDEKENSANQDLEEGEIASEPIPTVVRKRKWFSHKPSRGKRSNISISSDSLKDLIPDAKYLPENEVELADEDEKEENSESVLFKEKKVKKHDKEDSHLRREIVNTENENVETVVRRKVVALSDENKSRIPTRKISIVSDDARNLQRSPTPPRHKVSNILYITNLVRPFTVNQLRELLARTGNIVDGGFWLDKIKSKCYVQYENEIQAKETRHALHGVTWPVSNPKQLCVDFGRKEDMEMAKKVDSEEDIPRKASPIRIEPPSQKWPSDRDKDKERERMREQIKEKLIKHKEKMMAQSKPPPELERAKHSKSMVPVREWDLGKSEHESPEERVIRHEDRNKERERERERKLKKEKPRRSRSSTPPEVPVRKSKKKEEDAPAKLLDDLFRKTKVTPCIYWLPLTPDQIAVKEEMRRRHMAEHERRLAEINKAEKERERRRIQQREQRRRTVADRDKRKRKSGSRSPKK